MYRIKPLNLFDGRKDIIAKWQGVKNEHDNVLRWCVRL